jgi:AbrB family looped-hinge helix DNA binding protein
MGAVATTKLSSKGQVVIPEDIRERMGLKEGDRFVVIGQGDVVILKTLNPPPIKEFKGMLAEARGAARRTGLKKSDVQKAIKKVRSEK